MDSITALARERERGRERVGECQRRRQRIKWPFFHWNGSWPVQQTPCSSTESPTSKSARECCTCHTHSSCSISAIERRQMVNCSSVCVCVISADLNMALPRCVLPSPHEPHWHLRTCIAFRFATASNISVRVFFSFFFFFWNPGSQPCKLLELTQHRLYSKRMINSKLAHKCYFQH